MFSFSFLLELNWILQQTHELSHFAASSIVKKSLLPHVLKKKKKKKKGDQSFYIAIQQDCSCSETVQDWHFVTGRLWNG